MAWSRLDPGAGDPSAIREAARIRHNKAYDLRQVSEAKLRIAVGVATSGLWQGSAAAAFAAKADPLVTEIEAIASELDNDGDALNAYASAVEGIKNDADAVRRTEQELHEKIGSYSRQIMPEGVSFQDPITRDKLEHKLVAARADLRRVEGQWDALESRRRTADGTCAHALSGAKSRGALAGLTGAAIKDLTPEELLERLAGLSAAELAALFAQHPELADRIAQADPAAVAEWWAGLGEPYDPEHPGEFSPAQQAILDAMPSVIGNLDGIPYGVRNIANLAVLDHLEVEVTSVYNEWNRLIAAGKVNEAYAYLEAHGYHGQELWDLRTDIIDIRNALAGASDGKDAPPYQLIAFLPGDPTLGAISVGNLDTASQVTVDVPGMGTTVGGSMNEWTGAARNLYTQQYLLNRDYGSETGLAVVSWIGYDTPQMPPSPEVLMSDKAEAGARNLQDFLQGVTATRDWNPGQNLSIVAHSYGTTTSTLALANTPVENLTMLGSAGLDLSVAHIGDIQVDAHHVWSSEASGDHIANIGRGQLIEINGYWGLGQIPSEHPINPSDSSYGAGSFSSEDHGHLQGSDGHDVAPQVVAGISGEPSGNYGYLDSGTTPLYNAGVTSLGLDPDLVVK